MSNLKLVHSSPTMTKPDERYFAGHILRSSQRMEDRRRNLNRCYKTLDKAMEGLTRFMLRYGYVGAVCEVYHRLTGMQLGTIKMTLSGRLVSTWAWENKDGRC